MSYHLRRFSPISVTSGAGASRVCFLLESARRPPIDELSAEGWKWVKFTASGIRLSGVTIFGFRGVHVASSCLLQLWPANR